MKSFTYLVFLACFGVIISPSLYKTTWYLSYVPQGDYHNIKIGYKLDSTPIPSGNYLVKTTSDDSSPNANGSVLVNTGNPLAKQSQTVHMPLMNGQQIKNKIYVLYDIQYYCYKDQVNVTIDAKIKYFYCLEDAKIFYYSITNNGVNSLTNSVVHDGHNYINNLSTISSPSTFTSPQNLLNTVKGDSIKSCLCTDKWISEPGSIYYGSCSASSEYDYQFFDCGKAFVGSFSNTDGYDNWATYGQGVGAYIQINFTQEYEVSKIVYKDRHFEKNAKLKFEFSNGELIEVSKPNDNVPVIVETYPIKTTFVKMTILEVYISMNNGGSLNIYTLDCTY